MKYNKLIAHLLEMASKEFSNHGCNNFDIKKYLTHDEIEELKAKMSVWNSGCTDPNCDEYLNNIGYDWMLMSYFADYIGEME